MFGPDYLQTFGLNFPLQTIDAQGGMLGPNAPTSPEIGSQPLGEGLTPTAAPSMAAPQAPQPPAVGAPSAPAPTPPPAQGSPLGSPLAVGAGLSPAPQPDNTAPAAGVGSPFGKVGL